MEQSQNLNENEMKHYSDLEIACLIELDTLIDEVSEAALEAIEQAAGEAAKAAILSMVEREAVILREAQRWRLESEALTQEITQAKRAGRKNTIMGVLIGILSGLAVGVSGTLIIGGK
jgi:23S rRNA pseudoU1915 N3-methylase RlmH